MSDQPINDGGPAFPMGYHPGGNRADQFGMTIRDYFAVAALQGLLADGGGPTWDVDAQCAYALADAMIRAREAK
jgi:hypothetical protein